jgi:hypothetical protein
MGDIQVKEIHVNFGNKDPKYLQDKIHEIETELRRLETEDGDSKVRYLSPEWASMLTLGYDLTTLRSMVANNAPS